MGGVGIYGLFIFLGLYSPWVMLGVAVLLTCVGGVLGGWMERRYSSSDPSCVVLDEVAGYLVSVVVFVEGFSPIWVGLVAFVLFRVLDIWKPPPVGWAERLSGGWGVMADDLCAGVMVSGGIHLFLWLM
ncbi:MAG: phosphatidylglycerophosphatase A [Planctomycetota bacterium]|nr:MAG: phosphatidylglycerophosphatase A [Planctomycetota bacterium]